MNTTVNKREMNAREHSIYALARIEGWLGLYAEQNNIAGDELAASVAGMLQNGHTVVTEQNAQLKHRKIKGGPAAYWAAMSKEQRSKEMQRRMNIRMENSRKEKDRERKQQSRSQQPMGGVA